MKAIKIFALMLLLLPVLPVYAAEYSQGQAIVIFRAPEGIKITLESVQSGEVRKYLDEISEKIGAKISSTYGAISEANGGHKILALVSSETMTTEELICALKARPEVLSAKPNYKIRIKH